MSTLSKRDAQQLVERIRGANVGAHAMEERMSGGSSTTMAGFLAGFLGGLESVLEHFLRQQGCPEAAAALSRAMNDTPTEAEIRARNETYAAMRARALGAAA